MRRCRLPAAALLVALATVGCGDSADPISSDGSAPGTVSTSPSSGDPLPTGKSLVELEPHHDYLSPTGFVPELRVRVDDEGGLSTHRGADGFDVSRPAPDADAPLVVVACLEPSESTAEEAIASIVARGAKVGAQVSQDAPGSALLTGGDGPLVTSRDGGIALDAVPGGSTRIEGREDGAGVPWLVVTWLPDAAASYGGAPPSFELVEP